MNTTLWILLFEDILLLIVIGLFLYLRQRAYTILAAVLFAIILLMNAIILLVSSNSFIITLPFLLYTLIIFLARPFLPRPRIMMGTRASRVVLIISLFVFLILTVLSITILVLGRRQ